MKAVETLLIHWVHYHQLHVDTTVYKDQDFGKSWMKEQNILYQGNLSNPHRAGHRRVVCDVCDEHHFLE